MNVKSGFMAVLSVSMVLFGSAAFGANFKGFKRAPSSEISKMEERMMRIEEVDELFMIEFEGRAAFYRFPKQADTVDQARKFLLDRQKSRKKVKVEFNPMTTEIYSIADVN